MEIRNAQEPVRFSEQLTGFIQECGWRPESQQFPQLAAFVVPFQLVSISNHHQRLWPATGMNDYSVYSRRLGFEILMSTPVMSADGREDYELMLKLNQRMPQTKAHLERQFSSITDLKIRPSGRIDRQNDRNILPVNLGLTADGRGRKWSIDRLLEEGDKLLELTPRLCMQSGEADGFQGQRRIACGLMAAAELNPLRLSATKVKRLVQMALLDMSTDIPPHPRQTELFVTARLRALWNAHLGNSDAEFRNWFQGSRSNLVKAIANLHGHQGGKLEREHVEWALLKLTAQGLWFAASCQHQFAFAVWATVSPQFNHLDRSAFEQLYFPQPYLGGLTLPLIWERSHFLRPVLTRIWSEPANRKLRPILWRMLDYYVQMVGARRLADCRSKARTRTTSGPLTHARQDQGSSTTELQDWLETIAVRSGMRCRNDRCKIQYDHEFSADETVVINRFCRQHGALPPVCLSIRQAGRIIRAERER